MTIRILVADDHKIVRDGLRLLIRQTNKPWEVVGEASDGREAVKMARKLEPDIVVIDVTMPGLNGVEATRKIVHALPRTKIIAMSMYCTREYVSSMLEAGARAYIKKESAFEEIAKAIEFVKSGQVFLGEGVANVVVDDYSKILSGEDTQERSALTPREREVLQLLAEGNKTSEIAETLHVSVKTVETHRRQIMAKLKLYSVAELTKYAIRSGLTSVDE